MPPSLLVNGEVLLYGDVGDPFGWGDGFTPSDVATALAEHGDGDVTVRVNSGGGLAADGMAIYSLLKGHAGKKTIVVDGVAASAASLFTMAGDAIEMRDGAMMMIHDPSGRTLGTEEQHRKNADLLGKLADNYAGVYATRSGKTRAEARAIMKAETWLTADEAIAQGFATEKSGEAAAAKAAFDYRVYAKAPRDLPVRVRTLPETAATAAMETSMKKEWAAAFYAAADASGLALKDLNSIVAKCDTREAADAELARTVKAKADADADAARHREAEGGAEAKAKAWAADFYAIAASSGVALKDLNAIVAKAVTIDQAKDGLIDAMAKADDGSKPGASGGGAQVGLEDSEKLVMGATRSLVAKAAIFNEGGKPDKDGERNEFSSLTLREIARMTLERRGIRTSAMHDPMAMIKLAMQPVIMAGGMSSSDFTNILGNVANKAMLKGYEEAPETYQEWTGEGTLSDFKTASRVDLGLFPSLNKVVEGAEYTYAKLSDRGVQIVLATYGKLFLITRQAIVNDDLGAFTKVPQKMGAAANRTIGDLVYALLTSNPTMADNVALFHASHGNLQTGGGSAMSSDTLDKGRTNMATQKDPDGIRALNIRPFALLTPVALEGKALQYMNSISDPAQSNPNVGNKVAKMAKVVPEARLDAASATAWYLAGNPQQVDTIEVDYLNGVKAPVLEQQDGWRSDGVEFKVRMDAGVNLLDFRGLQKANGA